MCYRNAGRAMGAAIAATALITATATVATTASAQPAAYPNRPVRWVIPFAPGGGTDAVGRPVAVAMGDVLGQSIVYDNRGGGNGMIAGDIVAHAAPDGYTLLLAGPAVMTTNPHLYKKMSFDVEKDFTAITRVASAPNLLAAYPQFPPHSVQELITYARANPGKISWASSGIGTNGHLSIELFMMRTGTKVTHVGYKGAGPALVSLIAGEVQLLMAVPGVLMPNIKAGRVRPLAIGSLQRLPVLASVPTLNESGLPGMECGSWYGLVAPTGTPQAAIRGMQAAVAKVLALPEIQSRLTADGAIPSGNTPEQFAKEISTESAELGKVIRQAKIQLD